MNLVEVSSHAGARPKCAKDQGKIFNRNGGGGYTEDLHGKKIRYYAWKDSSYGEPDGLLGINCGHQVYPFTPGIDVQRYFPYDEKENADLYKKTQVQRELERRVRRSKRECMVLDELGDEEGLRKASVTLKQRQQTLQQYCADNGLSYKPDRTAVVGYNRTVAGKVNAANRRKALDKSGGSGIIKVTRNAAGQEVIVVSKTKLTGTPNTITQKENAKGGIDRNYLNSKGKQFKQISNHDHGNPREHPFGKHGEHAHDYIYDEDGNLVARPIRELNDDERKENADIL